MILNSDISPDVVKSLSIKEKQQLCSEIRSFLINSISQTGGHLASNLGTVELCVALHDVFATPEDKIVFDVGHQSYTHKLLTGRIDKMNMLRTEGGISGFPRAEESEHDSFIGGHSSISISAALGIAKGMKLNGDNHSAVAVIGDGAFSGGQAYEGLNNAGKSNCNIIVVLNDNEMSISKNTGAMAMYLTQIRSTQKYYNTKNSVKNALNKTPIIGKSLNKAVKNTKDMVKYAIYHSNLFENFGFRYLGPIDGHNIEELTEALKVAKMLKTPCLVHIYTKKGKGYKPAEINSGEYHAIPPKSSRKYKGISFTEVFGRELERIGETDKKIFGVTAAMKYATGLQYFAKSFRDRFSDVGIAEAHALTYCCGLSTQGYKPVFAVYASFFQRCYDQLIHDAAIEKKNILLAIDRAGFVGEDGETHQGVFDVSMLSSVPDTTIYSPSNNAELNVCLHKALYDTQGVVALRYPRGCEFYSGDDNDGYVDYRHMGNNRNKIIVTYGRIVANALKHKDKIDILQLIKIKPLPFEVCDILKQYSQIYIFEEGILNGGIGEKIVLELVKIGFKGDIKVVAIEDKFIHCAPVARQIQMCNLDSESMERICGLKIINEVKSS